MLLLNKAQCNFQVGKSSQAIHTFHVWLHIESLQRFKKYWSLRPTCTRPDQIRIYWEENPLSALFLNLPNDSNVHNAESHWFRRTAVETHLSMYSIEYDPYISSELWKCILSLYNPILPCCINFEKFLLASHIYNFKKLSLFKIVFQKSIPHFNLFYRISIKTLQPYLIFLELKSSELI